MTDYNEHIEDAMICSELLPAAVDSEFRINRLGFGVLLTILIILAIAVIVLVIVVILCYAYIRKSFHALKKDKKIELSSNLLPSSEN